MHYILDKNCQIQTNNEWHHITDLDVVTVFAVEGNQIIAQAEPSPHSSLNGVCYHQNLAQWYIN